MRGLEDLTDGRNRILIVFSPSATDRRFLEQCAELDRRRDRFRERDVVLAPVLEDGASCAADIPLSDETVASLRRTYGVPRGHFLVVLIGKDRGVKLRATRPLSADAVCAVIDAMPLEHAAVGVHASAMHDLAK